ncbi:palmitoyltransferase ZDHHC11-like [Pleurodeles waltl]
MISEVVKMSCYSRRLRQTEPEQQNGGSGPRHVSTHSRVNGWSLPLHPFQLVAWLFYSYLAVVGFGIYVPLLPHGWKHAAYVVIGLLFVGHLVTHLVAITVDPADPSVLAKKSYSRPMPAFDRTKHKHVIQNLHCYLCEADVGPRAKHCSACNKCIADFDHHCKWLNNCVGGKNYWFFFCAVGSAVLGVLLLTMVVLYVFIQYFVNPADLRTDPQFERVTSNTTWFVFLPAAPVETTPAGILAIAILTVMLGVAPILLLGHLLVFHLYLLWKRLSTYDYMVHQRNTQSIRERKNIEEAQVTSDGTLADIVSTPRESDLPLSDRSSGLRYHDGGLISLGQPDGICTDVADTTSLA